MANGGVPAAVLAAMLGDTIRTAEKYYIKISDESKMKAIQALTSNKSQAQQVNSLNKLSNQFKNLSKEQKAELLKLLQS